MAIKFSIENTEIGGSADILNKTKIISKDDNIEIKMNNVKVREKLEMLNDSEVSSILSQAESAIDKDSPEYQALLKVKNTNKSRIIDAVCNHLASFTTGTLANILASYITMK